MGTVVPIAPAVEPNPSTAFTAVEAAESLNPSTYHESEEIPVPEGPVTEAAPSLAVAANEAPEGSLAESPVQSVTDDATSETTLPESKSVQASTVTFAAEVQEESPSPSQPAEYQVQPFSSPSWSSSDEDAGSTEATGEAVPSPPSWSAPEGRAAEYGQVPQTQFEGEPGQVPAPPPIWVSPGMSDTAPDEGASAAPTYLGPAEPHIEMPQGGPNWMLALVCGWAAFTSFMEAPVAYAAKETLVNGSTVMLSAGDRLYGGLGFALLGLGLLLFGIEALLWGRRRRGVSALLTIGLPVLVSLGGIVCLILSHYPGSRI